MKTYTHLFVLVGLITCTLLIPAATTTSISYASSLQTKLTVTTGRVTDIKATQAKCSFTIQGTPVNEKGICFSDVPSPTISSKKSMAPGNPINTGTSILSGLKANTKYFVRAYAKSGSEVFYGNELSFTTPAEEQSKSTNQNNGQKVESKPEGSKK
jgi:hypothetical protein